MEDKAEKLSPESAARDDKLPLPDFVPYAWEIRLQMRLDYNLEGHYIKLL